MQSVLIMQCFICKVSLLCSYLYAECPYCAVLDVQIVFIVQCWMCKVSFLCSAGCAKRPYYAVLDVQSVLIMQCWMCKVSLLCSYYIMQSVHAPACAQAGSALGAYLPSAPPPPPPPPLPPGRTTLSLSLLPHIPMAVGQAICFFL